jgi:hypothetical protein
MNDLAAFARLLDALRPWLNELVIVGGWAHRLHRFHSLAHPQTYAVVGTKDADVAFSAGTSFDGDIAAALRRAGFREDLSGDHRPPITQYRLESEDDGFSAEFLVPLLGSEIKRGGRRDVTLATAGITAQKLRHLDLLLLETWHVRLSRDVEVPVAGPVDVRLPNPASFIAQRILIYKERAPSRRAQDALYIHDALELFGGELPLLRSLWRERIRPSIHDRTARLLERSRHEQFDSVTDVIRNAARIPQDRILRPQRFQATCAYGLEEIFGTTSSGESREVRTGTGGFA